MLLIKDRGGAEVSEVLDLNEIYEKIKSERGAVASIYTAFEDFPFGVRLHYYFYKGLMLTDQLPLSRHERELLAYEVSVANQCPYCIAHHKNAFDNFNSHELEASKVEVLKKLAWSLTKEPWRARLMQNDFLAAGYNRAQWQHAVMVASYFNFSNRCAHGMGIEVENNYEATCR